MRVNAGEIKFGLYIADPNKLQPQKGYCGFGGIPGFIQVWIDPNSYNLPRLPLSLLMSFIIICGFRMLIFITAL